MSDTSDKVGDYFKSAENKIPTRVVIVRKAFYKQSCGNKIYRVTMLYSGAVFCVFCKIKREENFIYENKNTRPARINLYFNRINLKIMEEENYAKSNKTTMLRKPRIRSNDERS
jgi:hypothetical protein